jgi:hypothetical protein
MWRWTGISRKKRLWIGGLSGVYYQTVIETLDGFSSQWGWSWGDFAANIAGSGMFIAQELAWDEQRIQMKWSFYRKHYKDASLNSRSAEIFGKSTSEHFKRLRPIYGWSMPFVLQSRYRNVNIVERREGCKQESVPINKMLLLTVLI